MAFKVLINNGNGFIDYAKYIESGTIKITENLSQPSACTFSLFNEDNNFQVPVREAYVKIYSTKYKKLLFTGFISAAPTYDFVGINSRTPRTKFQTYRYSVTCQSDDYLLNVKSTNYFSPQTGLGSGQILGLLANKIAPGFFDVKSQCASGDVVPYFEYDPNKSWGQYAKTFADGARFKVKGFNKAIIYQPFGYAPVGISYDETKSQKTFKPSGLKTEIINTQIVNDAIVIGDTEPGSNHDDYFVGDGFTGNFDLRHKMFEGQTAQLLKEDWSGNAISNTWIYRDPTQAFNMAGVLNVNGGAGVGNTFIVQNTAYEMAGQLSIEHGEVFLIDTCTGLVGGIYSGLSSSPVTTNLLVAGNAPSNATYWGRAASFRNGQPYPTNNPVVGPDSISRTTNQIVFPATPVSGVSDLTQTMNCTPLPGASGVLSFSYSATGNSTLEVIVVDVPTSQVIADTVINLTTSIQKAVIPLAVNWNADPTIQVTFRNRPNSPAVVANLFQIQVETGTTPSPYIDSPASPGFTFTDIALSAAQCIAAFDLRPGAGGVVPSVSGASGISIQPSYNGALIGNAVVSKQNHNYVLRTIFNAHSPSRYNTIYRTLAGTVYGGQNSTSIVDITWVIEDNDLTFPMAPPTETRFTLYGQQLPAFVLYAPINAANLNLTLAYTTSYFPPQGQLSMAAYSAYGFVDSSAVLSPYATVSGFPMPVPYSYIGASRDYDLGFGMFGPVATIGSAAGADASQLQFYSNNLPSMSSRIRLQSWEAQAASARVQNKSSISYESFVVGDDGYRTQVFPNLNPLPRSSEECEQAAAQVIADRVNPVYNGTYTVEDVFFDFVNYDYPRTGMNLYVNAPQRNINAQNFTINKVDIIITELWEERMTITLTFAPSVYLQTLLQRFLPAPVSVLTAKDKVNPPTPVQLANIGTGYMPDLVDVRLNDPTGSSLTPSGFGFNGSSIYIDFGFVPDSLGYVEIRRADTGWGNSDKNLIMKASGRYVTLPRYQYEQTWYMKLMSSDSTKWSRRTKVIRVVAPLVPQQPALIASNIKPGVDISDPLHPLFTLDFNGDIRNVAAMRVLDSDNATTLQAADVASPTDLQYTYNNTQTLLRTKTFYFYFQNLMGEYSPALTASFNIPQPAAPLPVLDVKLATHVQINMDVLNRNDIQYTTFQWSLDSTFGTIFNSVTGTGQPATFNFTVPTASAGWYFRCKRTDYFGDSPWSSVLNIPQGNLIASTFMRGQGGIVPTIDNNNASLFNYTAASNSTGGLNSASINVTWPYFNLIYADTSSQIVASGTIGTGTTLYSSTAGQTAYYMFPRIAPFDGSQVGFVLVQSSVSTSGGAVPVGGFVWPRPDAVAASAAIADGYSALGGAALSIQMLVPAAPGGGGTSTGGGGGGGTGCGLADGIAITPKGKVKARTLTTGRLLKGRNPLTGNETWNAIKRLRLSEEHCLMFNLKHGGTLRCSVGTKLAFAIKENGKLKINASPGCYARDVKLEYYLMDKHGKWRLVDEIVDLGVREVVFIELAPDHWYIIDDAVIHNLSGGNTK